MLEINNDNIYSDEAQEILGRIPSWIVRWGITVIFAIFTLIIIGCCFIMFPERINGTITITTANSPLELISKGSGNIERIFTSNGDSVRRGDILGVIASGADYQDILTIETLLSNIDKASIGTEVLSEWLYVDYCMGELQNNWVAFSSACRKYKEYTERAVTTRKKIMLQQQISKYEEYYTQMKNQFGILQDELIYEVKSFWRDSSLFAKGVISEAEYEESARSLLHSHNTIAAFESQITSAELSILQLRQQSIELSIMEDDYILDMEREIGIYMDALEAGIQLWKLSNLLIAPISGIVSFVHKWDEGEFIGNGESFLSVVPSGEQHIMGIVKISQASFGKVSTGQKVNVKLNGYPYMEYGMLSGRISYISSVPENGTNQSSPQYTAHIMFQNGMTTTYGKDLPLIQKMDGTAEIITKERSLIMRFLDPIVAILRNGI